MSVDASSCKHTRLLIGADPHSLTPAVSAHLATCAECSRFRDETLALDARLRAALELPLHQFRKSAVRVMPVRRYALAASLALALLVSSAFWLFRPAPALADEVIQHVAHESGSWDQHATLTAQAVADVLHTAGVQFDTSMPIVYAMACPFHGHRIPHLVVQTAEGPMTVMLLAHEKVSQRQEFSENGFHGVLLPAGNGSVAILTRSGAVPAAIPAAIESQVVSGVRW
jgi:Protein of unknown function (DUF3379)